MRHFRMVPIGSVLDRPPKSALRLDTYHRVSRSDRGGSECRTKGFAVVLDDLLTVFVRYGVQKRSRRDDDGGFVGVLDRGSVLHHRTDVDKIVTFLLDGAAQEPHEGALGHDLLGDGAYQ